MPPSVKHVPLMKYIEGKYMTIPESGCWVWMTLLSGSGYPVGGHSRYGTRYVHRWMCHEINGDIPQGYQVDHLCSVRSCINPYHLEAVTPYENLIRGNAPSAIHKRKTHCKYGHEFTDENIVISCKGSRICRTCKKRNEANLRRAKHPVPSIQGSNP